MRGSDTRPTRRGAVQVWDGHEVRWLAPTAPGQVLYSGADGVPRWAALSSLLAGGGYPVEVHPLTAPPAWVAGNVGAPTVGTTTTPYNALTFSITYAGSAYGAFRKLASAPVAASWRITAAIRAMSPNQGFASMGIGLRSASDLKVCGVSSNPTYFNHTQAIQGFNAAGTSTTSSASPTTSQHTDTWTRRTWVQIDYDSAGIGTLTLRISADGYNWDPNEVSWTGAVAAPVDIGVGGGIVSARSSAPASVHAFVVESWEVT